MGPNDKARCRRPKPPRHVGRWSIEIHAMKFGKYLAKRHLDLPEYADFFINYKALKKLINRLANPSTEASELGSSSAAHRRLQEHKATFFFQLERELEKVQTFYGQKQNDLETRLDILLQKTAAAAQSGSLSKTSVAYISLHEGFQRFRRDLERLEQFIELNGTGFSKVLKKWDKRSRSHTKELYLSRAIEVQPMFNRDALVALNDKVNTALLELEALESGERVVMETANKTFESDPSDDLYYEFVKFASIYDPSDTNATKSLNEWITQLQTAENPRERISRVFILAISTNAVDAALLALYNTGNVDITTHDEISNRNALHLAAASEGRMSIVELALKEPALINQLDVHGKTPLHYAAIHNRADLVQLFLDAKADIDALDYDNFSALHYSIFFKFSGLTETLVDGGAKVTGNTDKDYIPLNFACQYGAYDAVRILLQRHPDLPIIADAEGLYPLHIVARAGFYEIVPLLTHAGANINELDKLNSWTPLMYAASEGKFKTVTVLLDENADWTLLDEKGYSALFYACWEGNPKSLKILASKLPPGTVDISRDPQIAYSNINAATHLSESLDGIDLDTGMDSADIDGIPDLSLPPPIIPLQRYGHNFLDSQNIVVQVIFDTRASPGRNVRFNDDRKFLSAGRLTITASNAKDSIPRNVSLPVDDVDRVQTFQVENLEKFSIDFEILPTFGTRVMAKTTAIASLFSQNEQKCILPLMNALLRHVGEIEFSVAIVKPYSGRPLEIAKYDTYWKSTSYVDSTSLAYPHGHGHATTNVESFQATFSFVTGSSLHGDYHKTPVVLTRDLVPVVSDRVIKFHGLELAVRSLTFDEVHKVSGGQVRSLADTLTDEPHAKQLNLYVPYPTQVERELKNRIPISWPDMNVYVDEVLRVVFEYVRSAVKNNQKPRPFMFTSSNPQICAVTNWKQANYPVFFCANALRTDGLHTTANNDAVSEHSLHEQRVCSSIKEASQFAARNNLMGVVLPSDVLEMVPAAKSATRILGLVLVATDNRSHGGHIAGVDATETDGVTRFPLKE